MEFCISYFSSSCDSDDCPITKGECTGCSQCYLYKGCEDCLYVDTEHCTNFGSQNLS